MTLLYRSTIVLLATTAHVVAYSPAVHSRDVLPMLKELSSGSTNPFNNEGLDIELPDFHKMFDKIQQVSPLARSVINGWNDLRGFSALDERKKF
jgi:hypothetical protein